MTKLTIYFIRNLIWIMEFLDDREVGDFRWALEQNHRAIEKLVHGQVYFAPYPMVRPKLEVKP